MGWESEAFLFPRNFYKSNKVSDHHLGPLEAEFLCPACRVSPALCGAAFAEGTY